MAKPVIAVDLDDVLAANAEGFTKYSNERWGTHLEAEHFREDLGSVWGVSHEEVSRRMLDFAESEVVRGYGHFPEAKPILKNLSSKYRLVIVTSRRRILMEATRNWLEIYFEGLFTDIHHAGIFDSGEEDSHKLTKARICQEIGADYLIDDQLKHCLAVSEAGITSLLFGDYRWNQTNKPLPKNIFRVEDWHAVGGYFNGNR